MIIDKTLKDKKSELLTYFRDRASESLTAIKTTFGEGEYDKRAKAINIQVNTTKVNLTNAIVQQSERENWSNQEKLECVLMVTYCCNVVMIESRNSVRPYEYMDFSRRVGELWDPFCKLCFKYPINDVTLFIPPLFSEVKKILADEIIDYINNLSITEEQKTELISYYEKTWKLVASGEIQLECDLHYIYQEEKYIVDFKSGFGSNEKGNLNRLLLVASIYQSLKEDYRCIIFVRSEENNSYFKILKNSGVWEAYCGLEAYAKIHEFSGFNLKEWIDKNINWPVDFNEQTTAHFTEKKLLNYLLW